MQISNSIKRSRILFLIILLLSNVLYVHANNDDSKEFQIEFVDPSLTMTGGPSISLTFNLRYSSVCKSFQAAILLPEFMDGSAAEFSKSGNGNELNPVFNQNVEADSPQGYKKHIITFTPTGNAANGGSVQFTINKFVSHKGDPCTWQTHNGILRVGIIPNACNKITDIQYHDCSATINPPTIGESTVSIDYLYDHYNTSSESNIPYKLIVRVFHNIPVNYESVINSLTLNLPAGLECIGVTKQGTTDYYNMNNISVQGSSIVIGANDLTGWNNYFALYLRKNNTSSNNYQIKATVSYKGRVSCTDSNNTINYTPKSAEATTIAIPASEIPNNVEYPFLRATSSALTVNACNPIENSNTTFFVGADVAYNGSRTHLASSDTLCYEMTFNSPDIVLKSMNFLTSEYRAALQGKVSYYYKVKGSSVWESFTLNNYSKTFTVNNIEKILVMFYNTGNIAYSHPATYTYAVSKEPEPGQTYSYSVELYRKNGSKKVFSEQEIPLNVRLDPCLPPAKKYSIYNMYWEKATGNMPQNVEMKYNTIYPVLFRLGGESVISAGNINEFTLKLDNNLEFVIDANHKLKYYYGCYAYGPTTASYELNTDNYEILDNGTIKLKNLENIASGVSCSSEKMYFHLLYDVKLRNTAPTTHGSTRIILNNFSFNSTGWTEDTNNSKHSYLSIPGNKNYNTYMYAVCKEDQFANRIHLTKNDRYIYKYVVDNFGNEDIKKVTIVGSLPYVNDTKIINNDSRKSTLQIPFSSVDNIKITLLDNNNAVISEIYNGTISGLLNNQLQGWQLKFTTTPNPCWTNVINESKNGCLQPPVWLPSNTIPSGPGEAYFVLQSPDVANPLLKCFTKLVVTMQGDLPASATIGQRASASFAARADNMLAKENQRRGTITIAEEKNCDLNNSSVTLDCGSHSIRYVLPEVLPGDSAKLEWSTPGDPNRRLISSCNLRHGEDCLNSLPPEEECSLKNNLPPYVDICEGEKKVRLDATTKNAKSYEWSNGATTASIEVSTPGIYIVTIKHKDANCPSVTQHVSVGSAEESCFASTGDSTDEVLDMCQGDELKLTMPSCGVSYQWSPATYLSDPTISNPVASPPHSTSYTVQITTAGGCKLTRRVWVNVSAPFELETGNANGIWACKGQDVPLKVSGAEGYQWYPKDGLSCYDCSNPVHTVYGDKTYFVTGIKNGCVATKSIKIFQHPDQVTFKYVKNGCTISFEAEDGFSDYTWTFGDGKTGTGRTTSNPYNGHGTYNVCVQATNKCGVRIDHCIRIELTEAECPCQLGNNCP